MIITKLQGGLGNQMFQAATGYAFAKYNKTKLKLDLSFLLENNKSTETFTAREYELHNFDYKFEIANKQDRDIFFKSPITIYEKFKHFYFNPKVLTETSPAGLLSETNSKYYYLDGYWQSEDYFINCKEEILKLFTFKELPSDLTDFKNHMLNTNSISVHFRRGDYINNHVTNQYHGVCSLDYYNSALQYILSKIDDVHICVFSDEIEFAKMNFKPPLPISYIESGIAEIDLQLMTLCKHHIIANSSFSWWGARLAKSINQIVVAPKKWFNQCGQTSKYLIPKEWIRL